MRKRLTQGLPYLDSNVFIYPVIYDERTVPKSRKAKDVLTQVSTGGLRGFTSTLTWDEVVWVTLKVLGHKDSLEQGQKFLGFPNLTLLSIDEATLTRAQKVMEKYDLKPRDALHAAAAIESGQSEMISDDPTFDKVREIKRKPL
ncbi:MAG: type II toxin-antitoxin system VapC family toxin [Candidatus Brockarchaeota archaeon]|nr:type II toxin-antitoxin system VapC family toxin [Candidatus Brockarchaeota archaeon]